MQLPASSHQGVQPVGLGERHQGLVHENACKDRFMAELGHELRNALHPLGCALSLMEQSAGDHPLAQQAVPVARRQLDHMVRLVDELLDVGRVVHGKLRLDRRQVPLRDLVADVLQGFSLLCTERRTAFLVPPEPLWVDADAARLGQVLSNLLHNALKFTAPGGRIDVIVRAASGWAEITVADDGQGLAADQLEQVFELFKQGGHQPPAGRSGLGIGLALARSVVRMHGGAITAASPGPGRGATFTVRLPLSRRQQAPLPAAPAARKPRLQARAGTCSSVA